MTEAKPAKEVGDSRLTAYANTYSSALPSGIPEYHAHFASDPRANMMTTDFQSKFQLLLANSIGAKRGAFMTNFCTLWRPRGKQRRNGEKC